jgi:hypothetical protein
MKTNKFNFIEKVSDIHGNKYDYSQVVYHRINESVTIICPVHGEWETTPNIHLQGHDCPKCARRLSQEEFLQAAFDTHGPTYEYYKTVFITTREKIIVTCLKHGDFEQRADAHLLGSGCKLCQNERRKVTTAQFISRAIDIHGDQFDYSLVDYKGSHGKITIICKLHGEFEQIAYIHLKKRGCRKCIDSNNPGGYTFKIFEKNRKLAMSTGIFYIVEYHFPNEKFIKIGITPNTVYQRHKRHWDNITVLAETPMKLEQGFHYEQIMLHRLDMLPYQYTPINLQNEMTGCFSLDVKPLLF